MYPTLKELRLLERNTLQTIGQISEFADFRELYDAARNYKQHVLADRGGVCLHVGFALDIRLRADIRKTEAKRRIDIGVSVIAAKNGSDIDSASYSFTICRGADPAKSTVVRKIHFDYEPIANRNPGEPKPSVHMQVCGKLSQGHIDAGYRSNALENWYPGFEKPRIPTGPTSLALILNWMILEFQSDRTARAIRIHPAWRSLVAKAERTVLLPYYRSATNFLSAAGKVKEPFVEQHLYELSAA